jgi:hypothetical protein
VALKNLDNPPMILRILFTENRGHAAESHTCAYNDEEASHADRDGRVDPGVSRDPHRDKAAENRKRCPKVGEKMPSVADECRRTRCATDAKECNSRNAVEHGTRCDESETDVNLLDRRSTTKHTLRAVGENDESCDRDQHALEERADELDRSMTIRMLLIWWPLGIRQRKERANRRHNVDDALKRI